MTGRRKVYVLIIGVAIAVTLAIVSTRPGTQKSAVSEDAKQNASPRPYSVVIGKDLTEKGRSRYEWVITAAEATTLEERALTVMKAAEELRQHKGVRVARIVLEPDDNTIDHKHALAIAVYAIDGRGFSGAEQRTWEIEATGEKPGERPPTRKIYKAE